MVQQVAFSVAESAHISAQAFTPDIPVSLLPYLATLLLSLAFLLGFYFTTFIITAFQQACHKRTESQAADQAKQQTTQRPHNFDRLDWKGAEAAECALKMVQQVAFSVAESAHISAQAFTPDIPVSLLPYLATLLLSLAFLLGFYFTTLPKTSIISAKEIIVALLASLCTGFGTVALFNTVGVHV
ncbi:Uncharacterised protein family UPF0197 [Ceraceosorus bombacis]|uniref:Dolichyl-diphosphooligosaccharide-protein glycosyltransferase subunit OST5 n=1 Tax=Ceraceosorus bombacis TaxID=401625 RepID=A0A0P1BRN8_9BASI|nr:Uncharacterised protein family UPF0197 [Ceraceosorus bombacis]